VVEIDSLPWVNLYQCSKIEIVHRASPISPGNIPDNRDLSEIVVDKIAVTTSTQKLLWIRNRNPVLLNPAREEM
jgi:hypothetical protein